MTRDEMDAYARQIVDGGGVKKNDVVAFMRAYLESIPVETGLVQGSLPDLYFEIEKTETGIHIPRDVNRSFSRREAFSLVNKILSVLK